MSCNLLTKDIINDCANLPVKGVSPIAYILPYSGTNVFFGVDLEGAKVVKLLSNPLQAAFSIVSASNFAFNAGSEAVSNDALDTRYKHYFSFILSQTGNADLDKMDGIIVVSKSNAGKWLVYGAENGLWKKTQSRKTNDNLGLVTAEYESKEGGEESLSEFFFTPEISSPANLVDYLYFENSVAAQVGYSFEIDADKSAFVKNTDDTYESSVNGHLGFTTAGDGILVTVVPKNSLTYNFETFILTKYNIEYLLKACVDSGNENGTIDITESASKSTWSTLSNSYYSELVAAGWTITYTA